MYVVCVQVHVKPENVDQFIAASRDNQEQTRNLEGGNIRWDFLQAEEDSTRFMIYEVYRSKADFPLHQQTAHYLKWKESVADWMAEPRVGTRYVNIYPTDENWGI
jgi:(4S)-4-hydroxy-5-phosphonooxypentane-2,3-dione isomerase